MCERERESVCVCIPLTPPSVSLSLALARSPSVELTDKIWQEHFNSQLAGGTQLKLYAMSYIPTPDTAKSPVSFQVVHKAIHNAVHTNT